MRTSFSTFAFLFVVALLSCQTRAVDAGLPNIVFVMADDLGYGDVHALNPASKIPTPNLDRLATEGMTFTDAHSGSAVCTPTRYGVVTGRYCWRTRLKNGVLNGYSEHLIDTERTTIADLLKQAGYRTACVGKWHLGLDFTKTGDNSKAIDFTGPVRNGPNALGFDYFFGIPASLDFPPYVFIENERVTAPDVDHIDAHGFPPFIRAGEVAPDFKHIQALNVLTERATKIIARMAQADKPFFLYFPLTAPHKPVMPAPEFQGKSKLGPYGDFVMQTDSVIGRVDEAIERAGIAENTLLMVSSDNGSYMYRIDANKPDHLDDETVQGYHPDSHTANHVFRGTKADIWEGGHHEPFFARWPAKIKPGSECADTICLTDLTATCAEIAGLALPDSAAEDSFSFLPQLKGERPSEARGSVVHHSANGMFAIRQGTWKLILGNGSGGREAPKGKPGEKPYQLYNLEEDISETENLAEEHPEIVERLTRLMEQYRESGRSR